MVGWGMGDAREVTKGRVSRTVALTGRLGTTLPTPSILFVVTKVILSPDPPESVRLTDRDFRDQLARMSSILDRKERERKTKGRRSTRRLLIQKKTKVRVLKRKVHDNMGPVDHSS